MSDTGHDNWGGYTVGESEGKWSRVDSGLMKYERAGRLVYGPPTSETYRENFDRIFGKKTPAEPHARCDCGGEVGPDISGRLMCYGCGPADLMPRERHREDCSAIRPEGFGPPWLCTCQRRPDEASCTPSKS